MRVQALEVEAFRGFADKKRFDFDGLQVILLSGPNGHGKTSLFDAMEWGLTGKMHRFEVASDGRNQSRFVGNLLAAERGKPPQVRLELRDDEGRAVTVKRTGTASATSKSDYGSSELELWVDGFTEFPLRGDEAEQKLQDLLVTEKWRGKAQLTRDLQLTHLLGQEQISRFLRGLKGSERYDAISVLLGTDEFSRYQDFFDKAKKEFGSDLDNQRDRAKKGGEKLEYLKNMVQEAKSKLPKDGPANESEIQELMQKLGLNFESVDKEKLEVLQKELEKERREFAVAKEEPLRLARINASGYATDLQATKDLAARVSVYETALKASRQLEEVRWLQDRFADFASGAQQLRSWQEDVETLQKAKDRNYELYQSYKKYEARVTLACQSVEEINTFLESPLPIALIDESLQSTARTIFKSLNEAYQHQSRMNQELQHSAAALAGWERELKSIAVLNERYQKLLVIAKEFVVDHPDLESCPVCGTTDRTSEQIKEYLSGQQETLHPHLPRLTAQVQEATAANTAAMENVKRAEAMIERVHSQIDELLQRLAEHANKYQAAIEEQQLSIRVLQNRMEESEEVWRQYREKAELLGLSLETLTEADLVEKATMLESSLQGSEWDRTELPKLLQSAQDELTNAKRSLELMRLRLQDLGVEREAAEAWQAEDVDRFLVQAEERQSSDKAKLKEKEDLIAQSFRTLANLQSYQDYHKLHEQQAAQEQQVQTIMSSIKQLEDAIQAMKTGSEAVPVAISKLNDRVLDKLRFTIQEIFSRLNSHPFYEKLDFKYGLRYRANNMSFTVKSGEVEANPSFIFSAAQVNSIAISFFLAMALQQNWSSLRLVAMDDPVQSMDDINVVALVDLIRMLCDPNQHGKQFFISTHDQSFTTMMLRKFRYFSVGVVEYQGYGEEGPILQAYLDNQGRKQFVRRVDARQRFKVEPNLLLAQDKG